GRIEPAGRDGHVPGHHRLSGRARLGRHLRRRPDDQHGGHQQPPRDRTATRKADGKRAHDVPPGREWPEDRWPRASRSSPSWRCGVARDPRGSGLCPGIAYDCARTRRRARGGLIMDFGYFTLSDNHYRDNDRSPNQFVADIMAEALYAEELG